MSATRRAFLKTSAIGGAALLLEVPLPIRGEQKTRFAPNQWVRVGSDGRVTLVVARSEMGQGVRTALAMILAEELEADWASVSIEQASPGPDYTEMNTGGSGSVEDSWKALRTAAAAARTMLIEAAARTWKVDPASCAARDGSIVHSGTGRKLSYGSLVSLASTLPVPKEPPLKDPKDFRLVGTEVKRIDGPAIVSGSARYGLDVRVPGMLFAVVARPPVPGGKLARSDAAKARAVPGVVQVVEIAGGVAVVARDTWSALSGRDALGAVWDDGSASSVSTEELWRRLDDPSSTRHARHVTRKEGDVEAALASAATRVAATYRDSFQAHGSVEPQNATASVANGRCEIWAPTQNPQRVQKEAAKVLGLAPDGVTVHVTLLGGGFGRRLHADYAVEAAEVSKAAGHPVQVVWSREDDFLGDYLHPPERVDLEAGIDAAGRVTAWRHRATSFHLSMFGSFDPSSPPDEELPWGGYDTPYAIPNLAAEYTRVESPLRTGAWRAVFYPPNVFARESFLDEVAGRLGKDPLALRLELLEGDPILTLAGGYWKIDRRRLRAVLELAGQRAGWTSPVAPVAGRRVGRGIACNVYHGRTLLAHVAEVSVGPQGDVRVHRIVTAADCGRVVNKLGLVGQVESGVAWGLSYALKGEITIRGGRIVQTSFRDFPILGLSDMPAVEVHTIDGADAPSGFGEQPVPPVAPAVANAIFAATGKRVRRIPIRAEDLK